MRGLSKNVKEALRNTSIRGQNKMKIRDRRKLICEVCRKTSKKTLWDMFIRSKKTMKIRDRTIKYPR